ncbi:MAG TPA: protein-disulfide reductase DsbD domain-containing protein [Steroidobacteraceae bacterium]|nr:protein-disulfide reductase DsbD domain-containing protein [Steroidobacteraceae bacterium]
MITRFDRLRRSVAACAIAIGISGAAALAGEDASPWDGDSRGAIRLIAGSWQQRASAPMRAGIEIRLKPGWHTYWRYPGDAGVPPHFDFAGSRNVQAVTVLWPAPRRTVEQGLSVIGYTEDVILPLSIEPRSRAEPVTLRFKAEYALCEKLCLPAQGAAQLALGEGNSPWDAVLAAAQSRVPKKRALGEAGELAIRSVRREGNAPRSRVVIEVAAPAGAGVDLFAEGPGPDWALPLPVADGPAAGGLQRFAFDLDGAPPGAKYEGAVITITAVAGKNAIEVFAPLD